MDAKTPIMLFAIICLIIPGALAWGNGYSPYYDPLYGTPSKDPRLANSIDEWKRDTMYATHDFLADQAWDMLKEVAPEEAEWIIEKSLYYGTELPDSCFKKESICDSVGQYIRFDSQGELTDANLAKIAQRKWDGAVNQLSKAANGYASKEIGIILSYVSDAGLFSRVISNAANGAKFTDYTTLQTISPSAKSYPPQKFMDTYGEFIEFDGSLDEMSPYDAVTKLGRETYEGENGNCSAIWMDVNYDYTNPEWIKCAGRNFNNIINYEVDVLHSIYVAAKEGVEIPIIADDKEQVEPSKENATEVVNDSADGTKEEETPEKLPEELKKDEQLIVEKIPVVEQKSQSAPWIIVILVIVIVAILGISYLNMRKPKDVPKKKGMPRAKNLRKNRAPAPRKKKSRK